MGGFKEIFRFNLRRVLTEMSVGKTVILSTHIVGDIEASCNELGVLNEGVILYRGTLNDLSEYARDMIWELEVPIEEYKEFKEKYNILEVKQKEVFFASANSPLLQIFFPSQGWGILWPLQTTFG